MKKGVEKLIEVIKLIKGLTEARRQRQQLKYAGLLRGIHCPTFAKATVGEAIADSRLPGLGEPEN